MKIVTLHTDGKATTTGKLMRYMVDKYRADMLPWIHMGPMEAFEAVKSRPFVPDPPDRELLMRPSYTMNSGGDCDDKCIAYASYCSLLGIPFRFVAARRKDQPTLHHVFCEIYIGSQWVHADPTYNFNSLGREREPFAEYVQL